MLPTLITSTLLLALATATPLKPQTQYYGLSVGAVTSLSSAPKKRTSPIPVELYHLTLCGDIGTGCLVSELVVQNGTATGGLDINLIQCRGYKDANGTQPATERFSVGKSAVVSKDLSIIGSILCYLVEAGEC